MHMKFSTLFSINCLPYYCILFTKCEIDIRVSCWCTKDLKLDTTLKICPIITSIISSQLVGQLFYKFFCNSLNCGTFYLTLIFILRTYFKEIGKHWITPFDIETEWQDYAQLEFRHLQIFSSVLWNTTGRKVDSFDVLVNSELRKGNNVQRRRLGRKFFHFLRTILVVLWWDVCIQASAIIRATFTSSSKNSVCITFFHPP